MKILSKQTKQNTLFLAAIACLLVAGSMSAFAVPPDQVHRSLTSVTLAGACCQDVPGETISVTEPAAVAPVVLTWSMEYNSTGPFAVGIRVNGGGCGDFGPAFVPVPPNGKTPFWPQTIQWVIFPSEGLAKGKNTFAVCYGATTNDGQTLTLERRTLAVRISK